MPKPSNHVPSDGRKTGKTALIVLGMHRSGTSAITRVLSLLGGRLPSDLMRPSEGVNDRGFWESKEIQKLNDEALVAAGSSWDSPLPIPQEWFSSVEATGLRDRIVDILTRDFRDSSLLVLKDPRICRLLPLWRSALSAFGAESRYVHIFRNPLEVARSLEKRDGFETDHSLLLWLRYVLAAEEVGRDRRRSLHSFDDLLQDWRGVVDRISRDLDVDWPRPVEEAREDVERFLVPGERHHRADPTRVRHETPAPVYRVYEALQELRRVEPGGERASAAIDEVEEVGAGLEAMDRLYEPVLSAVASRHEPAGRGPGDDPGNLRAENLELREELDRLHLEVRAKNFEIDRRGRELRRLEGRVAELSSSIQSVRQKVMRIFLQTRRLQPLQASEEEPIGGRR